MCDTHTNYYLRRKTVVQELFIFINRNSGNEIILRHRGKHNIFYVYLKDNKTSYR